MNFNPHDYQDYAIRYIEKHPVAAVLLDMGLGKTIISLTAVYNLLFDSFEVHRVLVVAPLRVARDTWPAEIQKWEHLRGLTYAVAVGTPKERKAALMQQADITIINRENLQWLIDESGFPFDFDMVIIDELSSFKNHKSKLATDDLKAAVKETAASVRKDIQAGAPVDTGKYKKSWSVKNMHEDSQSIDLVVHSRNRYQLAHLLEHGHVKRGGGRVPAQPHIASAEERGNEKFVNTIKQKLGGGS